MREVAFAYPGNLDTPTGGYRYDRAVILALEALGHPVRLVRLGAGFPFPSADELAEAGEKLAAVPEETVLIVDGLAFAVLPAPLLERVRAPMVALCHHPLALETGLGPADVARLAASEAEALTFADEVVVTSPATGRTVAADFGVPEERLHVALPGLDPRWKGLMRRTESPPRIVSVGSLSPRKGHDVLIAALAGLSDLDWRCDIVGGGELAGELQGAIDAVGLGERVALRGALEGETIADLFERASVFALATRYEGFGMVFAEAMAAGLPVVGTRGGAVPDVVPETAGRLVDVDDDAALSAALRALLADEALRARLGEGARTAGAAFGGWDETARVFSRLVEGL